MRTQVKVTYEKVLPGETGQGERKMREGGAKPQPKPQSPREDNLGLILQDAPATGRMRVNLIMA